MDAEQEQLRIALELSVQEATEREILDAARAVEDVQLLHRVLKKRLYPFS